MEKKRLLAYFFLKTQLEFDLLRKKESKTQNRSLSLSRSVSFFGQLLHLEIMTHENLNYRFSLNLSKIHL